MRGGGYVYFEPKEGDGDPFIGVWYIMWQVVEWHCTMAAKMVAELAVESGRTVGGVCGVALYNICRKGGTGLALVAGGR